MCPVPPPPGGTLGSLSRDEGSRGITALPPADKVGLQLDAVGVFTSLGLNERLFAVSVEELGGLVSAGGGEHGAGSCWRGTAAWLGGSGWWEAGWASLGPVGRVCSRLLPVPLWVLGVMGGSRSQDRGGGGLSGMSKR